MDLAIRAHDMPGRTRFRVVARLSDIDYFGAVVEAFGTLDGVLSVKARPETASILIHHRLTSDELAEFARTRSLFDLDASAAYNAERASTIGQTIAAVDLALRGDVGKRMELPVATGLLAVALFQTVRGELFGPAVSHVLHAFELIRRRND